MLCGEWNIGQAPSVLPVDDRCPMAREPARPACPVAEDLASSAREAGSRVCGGRPHLPRVGAGRRGRADTLKPVRTATPPVIDGDLGDAVWQSAPTVTGFKTWMPDYGKDMADQTIVYFAHDAENLYFAFRAFDSEPGRIKASVAARDGITADDWVCINLDSFGDHAVALRPVREPAGHPGRQPVRGRPGGLRLRRRLVQRRPHRQPGLHRRGADSLQEPPVRPARTPSRMALIFERCVTRRSEHGTYPPLDPKVGPNFLTQNVPIEFADIKHYTLLEVLPDVTYDHQMRRRGRLLRRVSSGPEFGLTAKYGVTAQLVFDGAVNPDFSQVEADAGQIDVNLRYALFFPEKRPFFLEGRDSFNFPGADYSPLQSVVHTRTIANPIAGAQADGQARPRRHRRVHLRRRRAAGLRRRGRRPRACAGGRPALQARAEGRLVPRRLLHGPGGGRRVQPRVRSGRVAEGDAGPAPSGSTPSGRPRARSAAGRKTGHAALANFRTTTGR